MMRVLEIGQYAAGYAGRLFVQAGADVVRLDTSQAAPAWASDTAMNTYLHTGKRRVNLIEQLPALARGADIVICEAASAADVEALEFGALECDIKVAITPFGLTGPKRNWQATPNVLLAMGGYTYIMGDAGREPLSLPGHYLEFQSGALGFTTAMSCVYAQQANTADIGMYEVLMSLSQFSSVRWFCAGDIRTRHGSDFYFVTPSELFACADGWIYVNIVPAFWDAFTLFIDRPELLIDERFLDNDMRMQHRDVLHEIIAEAVRDIPVAEVERRAEEMRVPVGVVQDFAQVLEHPHLAARDYWQDVRLSNGSSVRMPGRTWHAHRIAGDSRG